jgi:hypothetical protein
LERSSPADQLAHPLLVLEGQIRECFGRVVYSHKTHEKCADILLTRLSRLKISQIVLSAITTGGFIAAILGSGEIAAVVGVVISTLLLVLNAYAKNYDLGELAQKHRQAASDLWLVREKYLSLLTDLRIGAAPLGDLQQRRDSLLEELHGTYSGAPSTSFKAYRKAQKALKTLEDMTFSESEIDAFLPKELKRG